jgi:hypothetical protein
VGSLFVRAVGRHFAAVTKWRGECEHTCPATVRPASAPESTQCSGQQVRLPEILHRRLERMAKGKKCPECHQSMYADKEDYQPKGTWVTYLCRNGTCPSVERGFPSKERVFESS